MTKHPRWGGQNHRKVFSPGQRAGGREPPWHSGPFLQALGVLVPGFPPSGWRHWRSVQLLGLWLPRSNLCLSVPMAFFPVRSLYTQTFLFRKTQVIGFRAYPNPIQRQHTPLYLGPYFQK